MQAQGMKPLSAANCSNAQAIAIGVDDHLQPLPHSPRAPVKSLCVRLVVVGFNKDSAPLLGLGAKKEQKSLGEILSY
jgi:hypothetical protein